MESFNKELPNELPNHSNQNHNKQSKLNTGQIKCKCLINKIRYWKDDWGIVLATVEEMIEGVVETHPTYNTFVIKGNMMKPVPNEEYTIIAKEVIDPKFGKQYDLLYMSTTMSLESVEKQKVFLSKILTSKQVDSLYQTLPNVFDTIKNEDIESLVKVKGIGVATANNIIKKYLYNIDYSDIYVELDGYGLTPNLIKKLVEKYTSPQLIVQKIKANPYILADEVDGIGFKRADEIALNSGIAINSPFRLYSFIKFYMETEAEKGASYLNPNDLLKVVRKEISEDITNTELKPVFQLLYDKKILWISPDKTKIALTHIYTLEQKIAKEIFRLLNAENVFSYAGYKEQIKDVERLQGWNFTEQQKDGIKTVLDNQLTIVTGKAGTGKTSIARGMLEVLSKYSYAQTALSGKAALRLTESTGKERSFTIHRLLQWQKKGGFIKNAFNPLSEDIIIVDEISMIGGHLFYSLIQAIKTGAKVILMCDVSQLESIGILNIAKDLIDSGVVPVVHLTQIHRQSAKSAIKTESIKVSEGKQITDSMVFDDEETKGELQDFTLCFSEAKEFTLNNIIKHFKSNISTVGNILDIQIIAGLRVRGSISVFNINNKIQEIYNPPSKDKKELKFSISQTQGYVLREGDKVINVKNNYTALDINGVMTPIFNGSIGIIDEIDTFNNCIYVDFQYIGRIVVDGEQLGSIELAYAVTLHKYQGSECHTVIVGLDYSAYTMLTREFVYTAITRAKKKCILCVENAALRHAIKTSNVSKKQTFLKEILQEKNENYIQE